MASAEDPREYSTNEAMNTGDIGDSHSPGELILKKLFAQFVVSSESKLKHIAKQPLANPLSKYLQRGEDTSFDQLLFSLKDVASFCLRSLLTALHEWRKRLIKQIRTSQSWPWTSPGDHTDGPQTLSKKEQEYFTERLELAVEFIYCMALVEILQQLPIHPVPESFIHDIEALAFWHFRAQEPLKERSTNNPNVANAKRVADLYAEVIGVVSQVRFLSVRMRFFAELKNPQNSSSVIISVIEGLSFVRVKMYPVEELEEWFSFLQECANYMLEDAKGEKIKHAMSALLVDILTPVAAVIKYEMSMPAVKKLVSTLYSHCYDQSKKLRHSTAYMPLISILLAIAEDKFFLNNWHPFVTQQVLGNLKKNDAKLQRVALDSLYRLLWVYMIRVKAEGNVTTLTRLRPIVDTLFSRAGTKGIQLKDFPPNIFVKIIYFIARERVDNAMNDIVLELVTKYRGGQNPERVIIGLRAFLMIADSLEKKEGDPPMPPAFSTMQSGSITRTKTKFLTSTLTDKIAKKIGIMKYYQPIRRALSNILKQLDGSIGNLVSTNSSASRAPEEALGGERKPKLDLLKTCVAAIPRIMPEGMKKMVVIELLSRLTIHLDNDLPRMAVTALQNIVTNYPDWRTDILHGYASFILQEIPDSCPLVLEGALKILGQLLGHWRSLLTASGQEAPDLSTPPSDSIVWVESCALVTLCSYRSLTRKYSLAILKEVRALLETFRQDIDKKPPTVLDVMEKATPTIIKSYLGTLSPKERNDLRAHQHLNLWWLADRSACFLEIGGGRSTLRDAWSQCILGLLEPSMLPSQCPVAVQMTWPYILQRMLKAYYIVDPGSASERPDRLPTALRIPRGGFVSQPELFLWRNYLFFACCIAPPSSTANDAVIQATKQVLGEKCTAKELYRMVLPLIRSDDEIGEVFVSAMGLANPAAFQDLIDVLKPWVGDSLDLKKSDTFKKKRRRELQRVHITRIFALAAENNCFKQCPGALTSEGELCQAILQFIEGIKQYLDADTDRLQSTMTGTDLRLHYSSLIANIINSFHDNQTQLKLFKRETRYSLFYVVAGWSGPFWYQYNTDSQEQEDRLVKQSKSSSLLYNVLCAMSALLCCGPVFEQEALRNGRYIYRWLENMLCSPEEKIQQLGRKTVQLLLQNNKEPSLLKWVLDHCYSPRQGCATQCFHALSSTFAKIPTYPCKMITILHVILYKTASLDYQTRERAMQLLHILDKRFFASSEVGSRRPVLLGMTTGSIYSNLHVPVSEELAFANPELTLPLFCEMIQRFEETPADGRKSILQIMKPWLRNVELVEESTKIQLPPQAHIFDHSKLLPVIPKKTTNPVLSGCGWGSLEGTHLVLHNLLYLTAKYGDEYMNEIESLWCALCTWPTNIRVSLNYLARLTCVAGNLSLMLQQAKRVIVYFSHKNSKLTITELMREVQCVELITADVHPNESPPFYRLASRSADYQGRKEDDKLSGRDPDGESWATHWRITVRTNDGQPFPLPIPLNMKFFASMKDILRIPCRHINMHRSNFALILLSEVVPEVNDFDWTTQLPVLLHVMTLGLDFHRPVVYDHSKRLLGNLIVLLACRDDYAAACEARMTQYDMFLQTSSSIGGQEEGELERYGSVSSINKRETSVQSSLSRKVHDLIKFVSLREGRRICWPFQDHSSRTPDPFTAKTSDLGTLVMQIVAVFDSCSAGSLLENWTRVALSWATVCSSQQFASQSFQICRALKMSLSTSMLREVLTRLAESASDQSDELQNYVLEIFLTLESAIDNTEKSTLHPSHLYPDHSRQTSDITPTSGSCDEPSPKKDTSSYISLDESATVLRQLTTEQLSISQTPTLIQKPASSLTPVENTQNEPIVLPTTIPTSPAALGHRKRHSRGHSVSKIEIPVDVKPESDVPAVVTTSNPVDHRDNEPKIPVNTNSAKLTSSSFANPVNQELPRLHNESLFTRPQSASGRLDMSGVPVTRSHAEPSALATVVNTATHVSNNNSAKNEIPTKESISRKTSAPPLRLLDIFAPLPSSVSPTKQTLDSTPQHQLQRPMSMYVSSGNEINTTSTPVPSIQPSVSISGSLAALSTNDTSGSNSLSLMRKNDSLPEQDENDAVDADISNDDSDKVTDSTPESLTKIEVRKDEIENSTAETSDDVVDTSPKQDSLNSRSHNTSVSSEESENVSIIRVPSHPDLRPRTQLSKVDSLDSSPIMRAKSVSQLQNELEDERGMKRRAYSGSRETVPGFTGLLKENSQIRRSLDRLKIKGSNPPPSSSNRLPLSHQNSPSKADRERINRRISADPERERVLSAGSKGRGRPRSMIEGVAHYRNPSMDFALSASQDFLSQLFWTSVSLLESDYESEYYFAQHLFGKVISHLDLLADSTYSRLEMILQKMKPEKFQGIQKLLLKGLTLQSTTNSTRELLSKICPHINRSVFDPTNFRGLPLNIIALLPDLVLNFEKPNTNSREMAETISKSCTIAIPQAHNSELMTVLKDMGHLFHLYNIQDFTNTRSIWLKSVCHYLAKGYTSVSEELLKLLSKMLEYGGDVYHQSVLWIILEYIIKLEENGMENLDILSEIVTKPVSNFIKGPFWQDALAVLTRAIKNSSSLVQPPNSHIAVMELGIFHQTLPGPTLNFEMNLSNSSRDIQLANETSKIQQWHRPQVCQRITREKLLNVINASGPLPVLFSSPSVIFNDEQTLMGPYFVSSEEEEEIEDIVEEDEEDMQIPSTKASTEVLDNSQPESVLINSIGDTFDFLNNYQYSDDEEGEDTKNMEGPFSSGREKTYSSSLTSSVSSLILTDEEDDDHGDKDVDVHDNPSLEEEYVHIEGTPEKELPSIPPGVSIISDKSFDNSLSPKSSSPSFPSIRFAGLEESIETSSTDIPITSERADFMLHETEYDKMEDGYEEDNTLKATSDKDREESIDEDSLVKERSPNLEDDTKSAAVLDKETIFDIDITTQIINPEREPSEPPISNSSNSDNPTSNVSIGDNADNDKDSLPSPGNGQPDRPPDTSDMEKSESHSLDDLLDVDPDTKNDIRSENGEETKDEPSKFDRDGTERDTGPLASAKTTSNNDNAELDKDTSADVPVTHSTDTETSFEDSIEPVTMIENTHNINEEDSKAHVDPSTADSFEDNISKQFSHSLSDEANVGVADIMESTAKVIEPETDNPPGLTLEELSISDDDEVTSKPLLSHRVDAHRAAHFISIADEEVEDMWAEHVSNLSRSKSPSQAVNTFFLFNRLFTVYRQQTCALTEQACNYMGEDFWNVSTHFVVTAELIMSELILPCVYLDTDAVSKAGLLDKFVFLVLEIHATSENLITNRKLTIANMNKCREFSLTGEPQHVKCLNLCHSIQQLHFYLLVFVNTYIKLLNLLTDSITISGLSSISTQLTDIKTRLDKAIVQRSRSVYEIQDSETNELLQSMTEVQALRYLQELIADHQVQKSLSLLHAMRAHYRDEQLFGLSHTDDVSVLVFAFSHFIAEGQEGIIGITDEERGLSDSLSRLMSQNVSLLSLLNKQILVSNDEAVQCLTES